MGKKTILLVEDNPADELLTLRALRQGNLANEIFVVRDGAEAIEYIFCTGKYSQRNPEEWPELILLDLKLPKVDGLEVLRRIRSDEKTKLLPIVVLTSSTEEKDLVESYRLGANSYIRKAVDFVKFTEAVKQLGLYWLVLNEAPPLPGVVTKKAGAQ